MVSQSKSEKDLLECLICARNYKHYTSFRNEIQTTYGDERGSTHQ